MYHLYILTLLCCLSQFCLACLLFRKKTSIIRSPQKYYYCVTWLPQLSSPVIRLQLSKEKIDTSSPYWEKGRGFFHSFGNSIIISPFGFSTVILFYHFKIHLMKEVPFPELYSFMTFMSLVQNIINGRIRWL